MALMSLANPTQREIPDQELFLLSDESGYVTGAEVAIDGGATL